MQAAERTSEGVMQAADSTVRKKIPDSGAEESWDKRLPSGSTMYYGQPSLESGATRSGSAMWEERCKEANVHILKNPVRSLHPEKLAAHPHRCDGNLKRGPDEDTELVEEIFNSEKPPYPIKENARL